MFSSSINTAYSDSLERHSRNNVVKEVSFKESKSIEEGLPLNKFKFFPMVNVVAPKTVDKVIECTIDGNKLIQHIHIEYNEKESYITVANIKSENKLTYNR